MPPFYRNRVDRIKAIAPFDGDVGPIRAGAAVNVEYYYPLADVIVGLLPELPLHPEICVQHQLQDPVTSQPLTTQYFTPGETITGDVANNLDIQELTFSTAPVPGFIRGEVITSAGGATGIVARRYSDGRYLVYDVSKAGGVWAGNVTGGSGGGGVVPGVWSAEVSLNAVFDSFVDRQRSVAYGHENQNNVYTDWFIRYMNMLIPPAATIVGATSGNRAVVSSITAPRTTAELYAFQGIFDTVEIIPPSGLFGYFALLAGDLAQLLNPIAGAASGMAAIAQRRARHEVYWYDMMAHGSHQSFGVSIDLKKMQISGKWNIGLGEFCDGLVVRAYVAEKAGAAAANPLVQRRLDFCSQWQVIERIRRDGT